MVMNATFWVVGIALREATAPVRGSATGVAAGGGPKCGTRARSAGDNATAPRGNAGGAAAEGAVLGGGGDAVAQVETGSGPDGAEVPQPAASAITTTRAAARRHSLKITKRQTAASAQRS
jgi:hypothetical protein